MRPIKENTVLTLLQAKCSLSSHIAHLFDHCEESAFPELLQLAQQRSMTAPLMFVNIDQGLQVPVKCRYPACFYLSGTHANVTLLPQRGPGGILQPYTTQRSLYPPPNTQRPPFPSLLYLTWVPWDALQTEHSVLSTHFSRLLSFKMHPYHFYALTEIRDCVIHNTRSIGIHSEQYVVGH